MVEGAHQIYIAPQYPILYMYQSHVFCEAMYEKVIILLATMSHIEQKS